MKQKLEITESLIGKYINMVLWSDVIPVGKIESIKGKSKVIIRRINTSSNLTKMDFEVGGFSAHCSNQYDQKYEFTESNDTFEVNLSNAALKNRHWVICDQPRKFHDYNF